MSRRGWVLFALMSIIWGIPHLLIKVADGGSRCPCSSSSGSGWAPCCCCRLRCAVVSSARCAATGGGSHLGGGQQDGPPRTGLTPEPRQQLVADGEPAGASSTERISNHGQRAALITAHARHTAGRPVTRCGRPGWPRRILGLCAQPLTLLACPLAWPVADTAAGPPGLRYASRVGRWVLAATVLGSGVAALDATVVGIALPAIGRDFRVGEASLQWVVDAYTLSLAGLLLLGGTLGDRYGRRRIFVIGTVWFAVASLLCGVAPDATTLILARALQGAGAALLTPGSLAILQASFIEEDRSKAIGAWSGLGGLATAVGPFVGGWLISAMSWRLVFFINLPVAAAVVAIAARHVPESRAPGEPGPLDVPGAVSVTGALVGITYGLIAASGQGWSSAPVLVSLLGGAFLLAAFLLIESRRRDPMLPLGVFASRQFSAANAVTFVVYGALGGTLFLLPTVLQEVAGYSPLESGAALLPVTAIMLALSARSGALAARIGPRLQMSVGPLVIAAGLLLLTRVTAGGGYLTDVLPAVLVFGLGLAINVAPLTSTAMSAVPAEHSGIASAVNNDVARTAGLIAVAVLPVAAGITGDSYLHPAELSHGFRNAVLIAAVACAAGGLLAAVTIRNPPRPRPRPGKPGRPAQRHIHHCALDAPPLRSEPALTGPAPATRATEPMSGKPAAAGDAGWDDGSRRRRE